MKVFLTVLSATLVLTLYPGFGYSAEEAGAPGVSAKPAAPAAGAAAGPAGAKTSARAGVPGGAGAKTGPKAAAPATPAMPAASTAVAPGVPVRPTTQPVEVMAGRPPAARGSQTSGFFTGVYQVGDAANGIGFSRHNLGRYGNRVQTETTFDICVYCHTPHTPLTQVKPIWAGKEAASTNYMAYGTSVPSAKASTVGLGSPSLACLSCHDGSTAFDSVANSPGKQRAAPAVTLGAWGMLVTENTVDPAVVSTRLLLAPLRTDDHPVNVIFRGGQVASLRPSSTIISQINLAGLRGRNNMRVRQSNLWSIKGYISDTASIGDLLRDGRIECSSCHDPHFNNKSWAEVSGTFRDWDDMDGLFLRRVGGNFASGVCRTCHQK